MDDKVKAILRDVMSLNSSVGLVFLQENIKKLLELHEAAGTLTDLPEELERELIVKAKAVLADQSADLSGPDSALISCWLITVDSLADQFNARQVSKELKLSGRALPNITTTMDILIRKEHAGVVDNSVSGHKQYYLTDEGKHLAQGLIQSLGRKVVGIDAA